MDTGRLTGGCGQEVTEKILTLVQEPPISGQQTMGSNSKIEIYGSEYCGYCTAARMLLKKKGLNFTDILVSSDDQALHKMQRLSGSRFIKCSGCPAAGAYRKFS